MIGSNILDYPDLLWTEDSWDDNKENIARYRLLQQDNGNKGIISNYWKTNYINKAHIYWHQFYQRNSTNFYKDRHYLHVVFPELLTGVVSPSYDKTEHFS